MTDLSFLHYPGFFPLATRERLGRLVPFQARRGAHRHHPDRVLPTGHGGVARHSPGARGSGAGRGGELDRQEPDERTDP